MRTKVTISIKLKSEAEARTIHGSLKPDNVDLPKGLRIDMEVKGNTLTINFSSTVRLETLISAMDDLLACCQASANTLTELVEAREKLASKLINSSIKNEFRRETKNKQTSNDFNLVINIDSEHGNDCSSRKMSINKSL
ncbi:MAG: hypothetical protein HXX80_00740 [Nitrososphaerales archaeon]|nr:hypothetical protein [Nitrososphaerales archaeon]